MPRPTSSNTVCMASAKPLISGSFTFSSTALQASWQLSKAEGSREG